MRCCRGLSMEGLKKLLFGDSKPPLETHYRLHVVTGDKRGAGTDANVHVVLYNSQGRASEPLSLNHVFRNDNERNSVTTLDLKEDCGITGRVARVEVWRDDFANLAFIGVITRYLFNKPTKRGSSAWFLDRIEVEEVKQQPEEDGEPVTVHRGTSGGRKWVFPLQRWVAAHKRYTIELHDTFLPQHDPHPQIREDDIRGKRQVYRYKQNVEGGPAQVTTNPW